MHYQLQAISVAIAVWLACLGKCRSAEWEAMGSKPQPDKNSGSLNN